MPRSLAAFVLGMFAASIFAADAPLQQQLAKESPAALAKAARERGDAARGAAVFFQPYLTCAKCHDGDAPLGPDLAKLGKDATGEYLVESILEPSKVIKKGFESVTLSTLDGKTLTGLVASESATEIVLADLAAGGTRITIRKDQIEKRSLGSRSLMPDGLANLLADRQQFLDLVKYLLEIAEHGAARAKELRPASASAAVVVPEYEKNIDHARLIRGLNDKAFRRGEAIYDRVCANCHGTKERPGSLPTSLRFAEGKFKNGGDPYAIYRTLTHGYAMMAPQTWMVPKQKYDVIHYIREAYLKPHNPSQYTIVDDAYLAKLPKGRSIGPAASTAEPWVSQDYGPSLMNTYEVGGPGPNIACKGIAIRLDPGLGGVSRGSRWAVYDHDTLRLSATSTGSGFIDWNSVQFNGKHQVHAKLVGNVTVLSTPGPGWANPAAGSFADPRPLGRDGRPYGPLPKEWAAYRGLYSHGDQVILSFTVGDASVLESPGAEVDPADPKSIVFTRTIEIGKSSHDLLCHVGPADSAAVLVGESQASIIRENGFTNLRIPAAITPTRLKVIFGKKPAEALAAFAKASPTATPLEPLTKGGPPHWAETIKTKVQIGKADGPFAIDTFTLPEPNPWAAQFRATGFDFLPNGDAAVCTWDGDVWRVSGISSQELTWRRIASGLFQPLGLKVLGEAIYVGCRDQIVRLRDLNGDGETDFYECFNTDHQVTEHFHEFAMGLQADAEGNFYYAKGARHALPAVVPQHGTLLRVAKDGSHTDILATGFRAPNGVCLNPDGTYFVTDQEGHWTPKNRINLIGRDGGFFGNTWGYHNEKDTSDAAMKQPLCWITNDMDRSPAELLWVQSEKWGRLNGSLLNISYGEGKIFVVPHETVKGQVQGGVCALPVGPLPTGIMRGRFNPVDGQLYTCGMFAWAGNRHEPGGFYRIRPTGAPMDLPIGLLTKGKTVEVTFTDPLDPASGNAANFSVKVWSLIRSAEYGSKHNGEKPLASTAGELLADGRTVRLTIPDLAPTMSMEIRYHLKGVGGRAIDGVVHNTIHNLGE